MEKFGFGGGPSKKELLDTIEAQKKQLVQYKTRFHDVVRAYKSLQAEKEALEASLKVLTVSQEVDQRSEESLPAGGYVTRPITSDLLADRCSLHSEDSLDTTASADTAASVTSSGTRGDLADDDQSGCPGNVGLLAPGGALLSQRSEEASGSESGVSSGSGGEQQPVALAPAPWDADRQLLQLKTQLTTLTSSLATVTQEKSRMEASFQADKRQMKQELEELRGRLDEAVRQGDTATAHAQEQLSEAKARIITQQHEREREQGDHALMLRELQKLLQEERGQRQDAELKLEDARETLAETLRAADRGLNSEVRLKEVTQERDEMRRRLEAAEAEKRRPDPRVEELQREMDQMKAHFQHQLQQEIGKAAQAEECLRERVQLEEGRVAALEERASELSELLGACEKARQKDQQTAQRLRERILQLDMENKTLAITASARATSDLGVDDADLDVNVLKDKMEKVKRLLQLASQRPPEQMPEIEKLGPGVDSSDGEKATALYYQQELRQLKEEFERYKVRAQVVLKNKNAKDGSQAKELEDARDQLAELKEKYINLRINLDEAEARHRRELEERQQGATAQAQSHRQELERLEAQHRESFLLVEEELHKQRDRAMALLAEKDQELEKLRGAVAFSHSLVHAQRGRDASDGPADGQTMAEGDAEVEDHAQEESDIIARALRLAGPNEPTLLLYAEQLARKEVESGALRRQKRRLEDDVHQLQAKLIAHAERHEEEVAELRGQLEKQHRDRGRDGANLEYLKNVIYRFLTLQDTRGRQQTLTAILTILHFSPQEKQAVLKQQPQTWWTAGVR